MHTLHLLLALIPCVVAEFIPGGSFGRDTIGPYNNCSGTLTSRPKDLAIDTLPNIDPDAQSGWERWDLTMYQDGIFVNMRWLQGDPASLTSKPADGKFELSATFKNGEIYNTYVTEKLTFTNSSPYSISIGKNVLTWDESQTWFNASLDLNGLTASVGSESIMLDKFSPYAGWIIGQLTEGLFCGIPMTRGYSHAGSIRFPWGQEVNLDAQSILLHMFAEKPIQTLATSYAIRAFRSSGADFSDTFLYESSRAPNTSVVGPEYSAFFLGRAEARGTGFEPYTIYAGTNSALLSISQINSTYTQAQLAGCANTNATPFTWNYSLPVPTLEQTDSSGGKTSFIVTSDVTVKEPFGTEHVESQLGTGLAYIYESPEAPFVSELPSQGGEQPS
ncbi:hypothetical protein ID866_8909 [Astraeus odoratus]|nr:hypothetical protein ID866_8909 [Astraeus odoratus]